MHARRNAAEVGECRLCALCERRRRIVESRGSVPAEWLFIGEAPGASEDLLGSAFVGPSGRMLLFLLDRVGIESWHLANVVACRPPRNREPLPAEVLACSARLLSIVEAVAPKRIVFVGKVAERFYKKEWPEAATILHPAMLLRTGAGRSPYLPIALRTLQNLKEGRA